jgi:hypothetical protein
MPQKKCWGRFILASGFEAERKIRNINEKGKCIAVQLSNAAEANLLLCGVFTLNPTSRLMV